MERLLQYISPAPIPNVSIIGAIYLFPAHRTEPKTHYSEEILSGMSEISVN